MVPWLERLSSAKEEEIDPGLDPVRSFDDSGVGELKKKLSISAVNKDAMDSRVIDVFRQGVELTQQKYRFLSAAPKIWSGNIKHWVEPNLIGQEVDFTHFDSSNEYIEKEAKKWDPVSHLYDEPNTAQLFNEGLQQQFRSSIDPFFIYGKKNSIEEAKSPITGIKSENSSRVEQVIRQNSADISYLENTRPRFDDQGAGEISVVGIASFKTTKTNFWIDKTIPIDTPFHDEIDTKTELNPLIKQLTNPSADLISALISNSNLDLDETLEGNFEYRSATAGFVFSDRNNSRYGTDLIAFGGLVRGW